MGLRVFFFMMLLFLLIRLSYFALLISFSHFTLFLRFNLLVVVFGWTLPSFLHHLPDVMLGIRPLHVMVLFVVRRTVGMMPHL